MHLRRGALAPVRVLLVLGAVVLLAAALNGSAGSATKDVDSSCDIGLPANGRVYCVVLTTYDDVQSTGGQKVEVQILNHDQNTLTNPVITVHPVTTNLNLTWSEPKPTNCGPGTTAGDIVCTIPNVAGLGAAAKNNPPPPPTPSQIVTLYFQSEPTAGSPTLKWEATGSVNEGPSGTPNTSVYTAKGETAFGATNTDSPLTFALGGNTVQVGTTATGQSSLRFGVPAGTAPYEASLNAASNKNFCFFDLSCVALNLTSDVPGSTNGILVWHFVIQNSPIAANNVKIIHRYDFADVPANAGSDTFTGDFTNIDGARIGTQDYYVRNANGTTFQLSLAKKGNSFYDVTSTPVSMSKIRLIGDDKTNEVDTNCNGSLLGPNPTLPKIPSVNPQKIGNTKDVDVWFCDNGNGGVGPWG